MESSYSKYLENQEEKLFNQKSIRMKTTLEKLTSELLATKPLLKIKDKTFKDGKGERTRSSLYLPDHPSLGYYDMENCKLHTLISTEDESEDQHPEYTIHILEIEFKNFPIPVLYAGCNAVETSERMELWVAEKIESLLKDGKYKWEITSTRYCYKPAHLLNALFLINIQPVVTIYQRDQEYGGAEEGGWFYHTLRARRSVSIKELDNLMDENNLSRYGEGESFVVEMAFGLSEDLRKRHYE